MSAVLPILVCGGGCLVMCWMMMGRMPRRGEVAKPSQATAVTEADDPDR
jgi:hypothetical protein